MSLLTTKLRSKAQLAGLKLAVTVLPTPKPNVLTGPDSALQLCDMMANFGFRRVCVVTDKVLNDLGVIAPLVSRLEAKGITVTVFDGVLPDPTLSIVNAGLQVVQQHKSDAVLAVGGGSSIDAAKVMALAAGCGKTPKQLIGILKARKGSLPLFTIPTTAGTGSEVTVGAVISDDETHQKGLVVDPKLVPLGAALDPVIMSGMPKSVTADTGIDAMTHALEAWMSDFASKESDYYSGAAMRMVLENLQTCVEDGKNLDARNAMGLASHYAGMALNFTGVGYVHAFAHQLGGKYGIPHGRANAQVLPFILQFNRQTCQPRLAVLARLVGIAENHHSDGQATGMLIDAINELIKNVGISPGIAEIREPDINELVDAALTEAHGTYAVPKYMDHKQAQQLLRSMKA